MTIIKRRFNKMTQIKFKDIENNSIHGGIMLDNGDVICACCGGLIPKDEFENTACYKLLTKYNVWIDFSEFIIDLD